MNSTKNLDIEVHLRPWVSLLPFYNFHTKAYEESGTGVDFDNIIQQLIVSLTIYLEKAIDMQLNTNLNIKPTKINGKTFQKYFSMDFLREKEISSEKGACLLLYTLNKNSRFDSFQNRIIAEGCFQEISIGSDIQGKSYDRNMGKDYSSSIKDILFKGIHADNKESLYFLVPPFLHQQKSSMNFKLLKPQSTEATKANKNGVRKECLYVDKANPLSRTCLLTNSVSSTYLFYQCPEEQLKELENKPLSSVWDIINLYNDYIEDKEIIDIECQFRNTCFEKKDPERRNMRKIYEDLSLDEEEESEKTNNMSFGYSKIFQPKLANALLELNRSIPMESTSMRASDFITITPLPDKKLIGLWEKLKMKGNLKQSIYTNVQVLLTLSNMFEHENSFAGELLTSLDKLILLHGPPGTGKSSLARAIFQKFSVKAISSMKEPIDLPPILLLELAPDRIYSRYYGESPKKLSMLFTTIETTLNEMQGGFIFMIVDEIESLATERSMLLANNETTDGVRMVNILLTHLDKLRHYKNFFMIGTSNLIESVDRSFKDRANALYELPLPNDETIYSILEQQIIRFLDLGVLYQNSGPNSISCTGTALSCSSLSQYSSRLLRQIAAYCSNKQITGRYVSRLPMTTLTQMLQHTHSNGHSYKFRLAIEEFLVGMAKVITDENV